MPSDPLSGLELRYHGAIPGWCKIVGLDIRTIPACEGGGFAIRQDQAERLMALLGGKKAAPTGAGRHWSVGFHDWLEGRPDLHSAPYLAQLEVYLRENPGAG